MIKNYSDLRIWQLSHELTLRIYKLTAAFPADEKFGIVSQIRRSSSSIPANIAEGFSRKSTKEFVQFLYQAKGSLSETTYFLILSKDLKMLEINIFTKLIEDYDVLGKQINALVKSLKGKIL